MQKVTKICINSADSLTTCQTKLDIELIQVLLAECFCNSATAQNKLGLLHETLTYDFTTILGNYYQSVKGLYSWFKKRICP